MTMGKHILFTSLKMRINSSSEAQLNHKERSFSKKRPLGLKQLMKLTRQQLDKREEKGRRNARHANWQRGMAKRKWERYWRLTMREVKAWILGLMLNRPLKKSHHGK